MKTILIIDDEYRIREVTKMTIEMMAGWRVLTASSGQEGVTLAQSEGPDAILLDMMMPDFDGRETLARLGAAAATRDIPVFLLTAKVQALDQEQYGGMVRGTIEKPFDPLNLVRAIAEALDWNLTS
ncbi:MAG: response regulator [Cyanobacteriota bacterium]|nr:response regulator [Cyanobacteriota bacterium]